MPEQKLLHKSPSFEAPPVARDIAASTLVDLLQSRGHLNAERIALSYYHERDGETTLRYGQLDQQARAIAGCIQQVARRGERALLVYPPGLEFVTAFFGCLYAGVLAVPATYPRPRRPMSRLSAIARDCEATVALTNAKTLQCLDRSHFSPELEKVRWIATDEVPESAAGYWVRPDLAPSDLAFIQYTSGSTNEPRGVMVSHGNLMHNLEMIRWGFDIDRSSPEPDVGVFWLPAYHDMGLIGGILEPVYVAGHTVLMSPASFLQRPIRWLRAISHHRAAISGAPNFAYDLCVQRTTLEQRAALDLSSWRVAFCGAEPINPETLERFVEAFGPYGFRAEAFYPCYGLAESTLLAAGGKGPGRLTTKNVHRADLGDHRVREVSENDAECQRIVSCGGPLPEHQIVIADPDSHRRCEENEVGEIWICGPSVAQGYWQRPEETKELFGARLSDDDGPCYLRTGDLGFLSEGHLYVTGRIKDVVIIRGRNHYPQDIERTVERAHLALRAGSGAAFSVEVTGQQQLVVVHEVDRNFRGENWSDVIGRIRQEITKEHDLSPHAVVLIRQASLPRTTSGKTQRSLCCRRFQDGTLNVLSQWVRQEDGSNGQASSGTRESAATHIRVPPAHKPGRRGDSRSPRAGVNDARLPNDGAARTHRDRQSVAGRETAKVNETDRLAERIESWLLDWLVRRAGIAKRDIDRNKPFAEYGLDSLTAVELSHELEEWLNIQITATAAWNYPTPAALSRYLARERTGLGLQRTDVDEAPRTPPDDDFERLLAEVESLSDAEAENELERLQ